MDGEAIRQEDILLSEKIVGVENVTLDESTGPGARVARPLSSPQVPTPAQIARHNLTHMPYAAWCPFCVACRRKNSHHRRSHEHEREIPLVVGDYAFPRATEDEGGPTILVLRVYPYRLVFACVVSAKGPEPVAVKRVTKFLRDVGLTHFAYRSDREPAIRALLEAACRASGRSNVVEAPGQADEQSSMPGPSDGPEKQKPEPQDADQDDDRSAIRSDRVLVGVPEHSMAGESQSNGAAENTIQQVLDLFRTHKAALEARIGKTIPLSHPIIFWLVEHVAHLLNKYGLDTDGRTAYGRLHGKEVHERICEFGEKILYYVPKKHRLKMDIRWRYGIFLGRAAHSDINYVALTDGTITQARAMVRLVGKCRWDAERIGRITGTPSEFKAKNLDGIEAELEPHDHPAPPEQDVDTEVGRHRAKITMKNLALVGFTSKCPRCILHKSGDHGRARFHKHTEACRTRVYKALSELKGDDKQKEDEPIELTIQRAREKEPLQVPDDVVTEQFDLEPFDEVTGDTDMGSPIHEPMEEVDNQLDGDEEAADAVRVQDADPEEMMDMIAMMDTLQTLGVSALNANRFARKAVKSRLPVEFFELYGRGGISASASQCPSMNITGLGALDLATSKPNGEPWNFLLSADRRQAKQMIEEADPDWVILSPPCTVFCRLNENLNFPKMPPAKVKRLKENGRKLLHFAISIAMGRLKKGKHFLLEHPASASSWKDGWMERLARVPGVVKVTADQCMFGLTAHKPGEEATAARKPTSFITSSFCMAQRLRIRCSGDHEHTPLHGKQLEAAAFYPAKLRLAVLRGMRDTADFDAPKDYDEEVERATQVAGVSVCGIQHSVVDQVKAQHSAQNKPAIKAIFKFRAGGQTEVDLTRNMKDRYLDEYTREPIPIDLLRTAMHDEVAWLNEHVWVGVPEDEARAEDDAIIVGTRWVNCNKGDSANPDVRARLVAQEVNTYQEEAYFAATPPLECKRALISQMVTERTRNGAPLKLCFVDVRKAYFNGRPTRNLYVRLPKEMGLPRSMLGKLQRCLYGTRDAGHIWEAVYGDALIKMGFIQGVASPCCFFHPIWKVSLVVHGDDFTALGTDASLVKFEQGMQAAFEVKLKGKLGPEKGDEKEMRILNRILRITDKGVAYEADPRHVEILVRSLGLEECRLVSTPGVKMNLEDAEYSEPDQTIVSAMTSERARRPEEREDKRVCRFSDEVDISEITGYAKIYGIHPRTFEIFADARGRLHKRSLSHSQDPFTGQLHWEMSRRRSGLHERTLHNGSAGIRQDLLERTLLDGAAWELNPADMIAAVSKKKKFKPKRLGTKAVKAIELEAKAGGILVGEAATDYRALSARINYLASDRPDIAYAAKELCRDFASPTQKSIERLKRCVRYLKHKPRLVWHYDFQPECKDVTVCVDTDFAGCQVTRRSTSGGAIFHGKHLLRHWSKTQTTVALSSAEAELTGICAGSSQGIGMRSMMVDLGFTWDLIIRSDAAAAIGICKRRGLGKVRHLATADLWVQDHIRTGDFVLNKILGAENPADILTKNVDRMLLLKHSETMQLRAEDGRAASAPKVDQ